MERKTVLFLLIACNIFLCRQVFAASLYGDINLHVGGDTIVDSNDPLLSSLFIPKAGDATGFTIGLEFMPVKLLNINFGVGQRENKLVDDSSDMVWKMETGEVNLGFNLGLVRFGAGRVKFQNPRLRGIYDNVDVGKNFHDAYGYQFYVDFRVSPNVFLGIRRIEVDYTDMQTGNVYDGDSYGIGLHVIIDDTK